MNRLKLHSKVGELNGNLIGGARYGGKLAEPREKNLHVVWSIGESVQSVSGWEQFVWEQFVWEQVRTAVTNQN
ncbi:unannotated protein [freshwater metagenome]|uniref:Unannotated protein n=1 Tax=freshwater metagenome TaxID=449393 RepID=A0A6J7H2D5_9ZZZZ